MSNIFAKMKKALAHVTRAISKFNEFTENYKAVYIARAIIRAIVLYFVFLGAYRFVCWEIPDYDDYYMNSGRMITLFRILFVFLIYFTVVRTMRVFDTRARRHSETAKAPLISVEFVVDTLVFFVFTYLPIGTNALLHKEAIYAVHYLAPISETTALITVTVVFLPVYLILGFLADLSARRYWENNTKNIVYDELDEFDENGYVITKSATRISIGKTIPRRKRFWFEDNEKTLVDRLPVFLSDWIGTVKWLAIALVVYYVGLKVLPSMIMSVSSIIALIVTKYLKEALTTLAVLTLIIFIAVYQRKFRKRHKFIKRLKRVCRENGFEILLTHKLYHFKDADKQNFSVKAHKKTYDCKFISSKKRRCDITFYEDGSYVSRNAFKSPLRLEAARIDTYINYTFEGENTKVLILNPAPWKIHVHHGGATTELDVADSVCGYKIFTGSSFLNALERDCIDRKINS